MARDANASKSVVKLQAWVRGYLVRKKFTQLKSEYKDIVKHLEGTDAKVCWRSNEILCLPAVFHGCLETTERRDVLSENGRQKPCNELLIWSEVVQDDSNTKEKSQIQTSLNEIYNSTIGNESIKRQNLVTNCERTKDCISDGGFQVMPTVDFTNGNGDERSAFKNLEIPSEGSAENTKTDKKQHTDITDEINTNDLVEGQVCPYHTSYPKDKISLQKLREDLTMELLWIEQAIESRINYLAMKKNMDNQLNK